MRVTLEVTALALLTLGVLGCSTTREERPSQEVSTSLSLGYRLGALVSEEAPAEELPAPAGLFVRQQWDEEWASGLGVDFREGEISDLAERLALSPAPSPEDTETLQSATQVELWVERTLWDEPGQGLYALAGAGAAFVELEGVQGALPGGGSFNVRGESDTEAVAFAGLGYRLDFGIHWTFDVGARYEHHFADWQIVDTVSGRSSAVDDYGLVGVLFGIRYRF